MPVMDYERGKILGEGTFGVVFQAIRVSDESLVAIKRIKSEIIVRTRNEGLNITALREIKYLRELKHPNIIELKDVYLVDSSIHLVFDYCVTDLEDVINQKEIFFSPSDIKSFFVMMLRAVEHCHVHFILHRDIKPGNMLISSTGDLKLTDFGFARHQCSPQRQMTSNVVTSWYRAPELFFGASLYSGGVDMWALGLIFIELFVRTPLLRGESDIEQLALIFNAFGTPSEAMWPGVTTLPKYVKFEERDTPLDFSSIFITQEGDNALNIFLSIMQLAPSSRLTASAALLHPYVTTGCKPTPPANLPMMPSLQKKVEEEIHSLTRPDKKQRI